MSRSIIDLPTYDDTRNRSISELHVQFESSTRFIVSEPNPLRPLRDLQYGLGEMVFGGCRHLEYMNIWCFNEPK